MIFEDESLGSFLAFLFFVDLIEELGILYLQQSHHVLDLLGDDLLIHFDLGEAISDVILYLLFAELVEVQAQQDYSLELKILIDVQPVIRYLVYVKYTRILIHFFKAQIQLLYQHPQQI